MTNRLVAVQPVSTFDLSKVENESESENIDEGSQENFYKAFNGFNLTLFWIVVMLISYILAFTIAILVILCDQKFKFLPYHQDENITNNTKN